MASNKRHVAVEQLPRREALARRSLLNFLAVLVGSGEEEDVIAVEPHEAGNRVGRDHFVSVADMRWAIRIRDRGRDVVRRARRLLLMS